MFIISRSTSMHLSVRWNHGNAR